MAKTGNSIWQDLYKLKHKTFGSLVMDNGAERTLVKSTRIISLPWLQVSCTEE